MTYKETMEFIGNHSHRRHQRKRIYVEEAALRLRDSAGTYFTNRRLIFIIGVLADKDYQSILRIMAPLADTIITLTPVSPRALPSEKLAEKAKNTAHGCLTAQI